MTITNIQPDEAADLKKVILHVCQREIVRPLRDQIMRLSGYMVESTCDFHKAPEMFKQRFFDLVLVDVEGERQIHMAERLCSTVKTARPGQRVAFVCNWRVAILTDCPDEVLRTEFNPAAFIAGVHKAVEN